MLSVIMTGIIYLVVAQFNQKETDYTKVKAVVTEAIEETLFVTAE